MEGFICNSPSKGRDKISFLKTSIFSYKYVLHFQKLVILDDENLQMSLRFQRPDDKVADVERWIEGGAKSQENYPSVLFYFCDNVIIMNDCHEYMMMMCDFILFL